MIWTFGKTVTLLARARSGVDSDGNDVFAVTETVFDRCPSWPGGAGAGLTGIEVDQGRDTTSSNVTVLLPAGTVVDTVYGFRVDELTYEVEGVPALYKSPFTGLDPGVLIRGKRVTG